MSGGQDVIFCAACRKSVYNAPKTETGKPIRRVVNREGLKTGQRERILQSHGAKCAICLTDTPGVGGWHIGHVISIADCKSYGFEADDYNQDENLCVLCEACNLGVGAESLLTPTMIRIFLTHNRAKREAGKR